VNLQEKKRNRKEGVMDVVDVREWNQQVSEFKNLADKTGAAFDLKRFPDGKERVVIEQWFKQKETRNGQTK
jgi:hypothetical protein